MDEGEEVSGEFIEAREDPTEVLELADETLDEVALLVRFSSVVAGLDTIGFGGMTAWAWMAWTNSTNQSASKALSAITCCRSKPRNRSGAWVISCR